MPQSRQIKLLLNGEFVSAKDLLSKVFSRTMTENYSIASLPEVKYAVRNMICNEMSLVLVPILIALFLSIVSLF